MAEPAPARPAALLGLTAVTMAAFAANSVLNRMALAEGSIGPAAFAAIRVAAGAAALAAFLLLRRGTLSLGGPRRAAGALSLAVYLVGFSCAYVALDAGLGALILFGTVQVVMFGGALAAREPVPPARWAGALLAFAGLAVLLWPEGAAPPAPWAAALMVAAATGWGLYSLVGRATRDPAGATAANFVLATPLCLVALAVLPEHVPPQPAGIALAILSGAVTSGMGYVLWYAILPRLGVTRAAVAQMTAPLIAVAGGVLLLGEVPGWRLAAAAAMIAGGVALSLRPARR